MPEIPEDALHAIGANAAAIIDGLLQRTEPPPAPPVTWQSVMTAYHRLFPKLFIFCHPDDLDRIADACRDEPRVEVTASPFVTPGQMVTARTDDLIKHGVTPYIARETYPPTREQP
jgi:hypothetical protein